MYRSTRPNTPFTGSPTLGSTWTTTQCQILPDSLDAPQTSLTRPWNAMALWWWTAWWAGPDPPLWWQPTSWWRRTCPRPRLCRQLDSPDQLGPTQDSFSNWQITKICSIRNPFGSQVWFPPPSPPPYITIIIFKTNGTSNNYTIFNLIYYITKQVISYSQYYYLKLLPIYMHTLKNIFFKL